MVSSGFVLFWKGERNERKQSFNNHAGMLGGILSSSFISNINCEMITAKYIRLVDNEGNALMKLYVNKRFDDDVGNGGPHIELYNNKESIFSQWSTQTQSLSFHDRDNVNKGFNLGPRFIDLSDENGTRLMLGNSQQQETQDKYGLEPYFIVIFDEKRNNIWSAP